MTEGFERLESETKWEGRIVSARVERWRQADGEEVEREVVSHQGAVAVVAHDDDTVWLVRCGLRAGRGCAHQGCALAVGEARGGGRVIGGGQVAVRADRVARVYRQPDLKRGLFRDVGRMVQADDGR